MTNEFEHIKQLTRRFMDGQTTIEEEARLASYYRTHDVPREWSSHISMQACRWGRIRLPPAPRAVPAVCGLPWRLRLP